jgi:hypothetical protein
MNWPDRSGVAHDPPLNCPDGRPGDQALQLALATQIK